MSPRRCTRRDLPARLLELELTESILVRDAGEALQRLHALSQLGVKLAIDDFGTGYSSLAYLKRFPIEKLKIDRSFVRGTARRRERRGIVRAVVQLARALNLKVIAEGVETEAQRHFLQAGGLRRDAGLPVRAGARPGQLRAAAAPAGRQRPPPARRVALTASAAARAAALRASGCTA